MVRRSAVDGALGQKSGSLASEKERVRSSVSHAGAKSVVVPAMEERSKKGECLSEEAGR